VIQLAWDRREPPLQPAAVAATGSVVDSLRKATINRIDLGGELRAVGGDGWLVVLGDSADLPWADGAIYLGWDSGLLVPTTSAPSPPAGLLRTALPQERLVVLLPDHVLVSKTPARGADPALLAGT
jgi:MoxR-vWA-beta-propeller ternary system domain bpX5